MEPGSRSVSSRTFQLERDKIERQLCWGKLLGTNHNHPFFHPSLCFERKLSLQPWPNTEMSSVVLCCVVLDRKRRRYTTRPQRI